MGKHFPTIIASIMLIAMLGLMSNCQVNTDVPLEYQSPMETSEHLDENGEEINKILEKNFIFLRSYAMSLLCI
jgi:hypothetical protein